MSGYYNRNNRGITKKLGPVTAYADAVLAGYKGTREQWAQDMAKLGQNVTQVAQNTELTTELAEQTRENTEQVAKDTADVRRLADETSDNAVQVASNTAESNRLAKETKQAAAQAKADAEYAGAAADNFRVDTTLSEAGKAAEAKTTGEKFAQLSEEIVGVSEEVTPLVLGVDLLDDNPHHQINIDGSVVETENDIGVSRQLACKVGATISVKFSSSTGSLVFAVYNANGELNHSLVAEGYSNNVEETYTFTDTDVYFRFAGTTMYRKKYSIVCDYVPKLFESVMDMEQRFKGIVSYSDSPDVTAWVSLEGGINKAGNVYVTDAYKYSDYIAFAEGSVVVGSNVRASDLCIIAVYDKNKIFDIERSVIGNSVKENVEFVMPYDGFVKLSSRITELENGGTFVITNKIGKRFDEIESELASIDKRVVDIENNSKTETNLPQYWEDYLSDKIESIIQKDMLIGNSGDSFVFITDVHIPRNQMFSPLLIKRISEKTSVVKVFNGGDYLDNDTGDDGKNTAVNRLLTWRNQSVPEYAVRGNHDLNNFNGENASNALTVGEWYALMVKQAESRTNTDKKDYYVVDNESQKMRYIVMCSEGDRPVDWLCERLTELDGDWTVLIIQHRYWSSAIDSVSTAGNQIVTAINSVYANVKATIVGILCGHTHVDHAITEPTNSYLIIASTCDGLTGSEERTAGTTTEQAFDVVHIDTANRKLYMTRIGHGADREFSY